MTQAAKAKEKGEVKVEDIRVCSKDGQPICLHLNICTLRAAMAPLIENWKTGEPPIYLDDLAKICKDFLRGPMMETEDGDRVLFYEVNEQ
jgi:hypothetical protein